MAQSGWLVLCKSDCLSPPHAGYVQGRFLREMTGGHVVVDMKVLLYMVSLSCFFPSSQMNEIELSLFFSQGRGEETIKKEKLKHRIESLSYLKKLSSDLVQMDVVDDARCVK